jgi:dipeptidyl aminopeptidase/acylaminoacyl peptidase
MLRRLQFRWVFIAALGLLFHPQLCQSQDGIDWEYAKALRRKELNGEPLTQQESKDLALAKSALAEKNRFAGMEGDGNGPLNLFVPPADISEEESPVLTIDTVSADGRRVVALWRKPKHVSKPAVIVFIHGGLTQYPEQQMRRQLLSNPVLTRFLAKGYAVVQATFRTYEDNVQSREPIEDVRSIVRSIAQDSSIDSTKVVLFGGSGGGSIALELASDPLVSAVVAGEPATVLYTGMLTTGDYTKRLEIMKRPEVYFTEELRKSTLLKLKEIRAPILILHSDQHDLVKLNKPIFLPLMKEAGLDVRYQEYPGYGHGFYFGAGDDRWGKGATKELVEEIISDVDSFLSGVFKDA